MIVTFPWQFSLGIGKILNLVKGSDLVKLVETLQETFQFCMKTILQTVIFGSSVWKFGDAHPATDSDSAKTAQLVPHLARHPCHSPLVKLKDSSAK
ncbi:hypothetical protein J6590_008396 [Homalodisca vitripennis]|nr:hypothetical protein J6590_008396 [Homalodisca vitripennis]